MNPLGLGFEVFRGQRPRFLPGREIEVEIGCGEAQFLFERAKEAPERVYLGFEVRSHLVDWVNQQASASGASVQAIFGNANHHLRALLPEDSVSRVFLNFPDPWFKRRHRKRRMIDDALVVDIHHVLKSGGEVFFQSDVWSVALDAMECFERRDEKFVNEVGAWSFWRESNPYHARSWREAHCEAHGMGIWRLFYRALAA